MEGNRDSSSESTINASLRAGADAEWPWYGQLCVMALLLLAIVLIFSVSSLLPSMTETASAPLITGYVALTAVLISGTFLFMTFRMDRNARNEARTIAQEAVDRVELAATNAAKEEAERTAESAVQRQLGDIVRSALFSNLDVLKESVDSAVGSMMPRYVGEKVKEYLKDHLAAEVTGALVGEQGREVVRQAVQQETVIERIETVVRNRLDSTVRRHLPAMVSVELPEVVTNQLTQATLREIISSSDDIKNSLEENLPEIADRSLAKLVESRLPGAIETHFRTRRRWSWLGR